ncbi:hypothetical protein [Fibrella forsythiae]|uniref:Uncharacterized protein n=1 Tax=Fibrella forsythiae TaxID=2817061 RepID=A0ABS3JAG2_9BACT|nr:hypothetical protein [Fibrella forsythiae]MBO0946986.1 hypothetical protein [Fibrella forsythiae]
MADRDPQISFRVKPEVMAMLTELAKGQSMYAFMPGFVDAALKDEQEAQQTVENLRHELSNQAAQVDKWKAEYEGLKVGLSEARNELVALKTEREKLLAKFEKQTTDTAATRLENIELTTQLGAANTRLKRVIDKAVKNSFVSRKDYEKL